MEELLTRGVQEIFIKDQLLTLLHEGRPLRVKFGIDPTGPKIHLGRAIPLWKLRQFQDAGHTIVLIIGDFTATIGDPSDKLDKRPFLSDERIAENLSTYKEQIGMILDMSKVEFHFNSTWLSQLTMKEILTLTESFSVPQMAARRNFKERLDKGEEVSLREFMYPLLQGYDSVAVHADIEIGGMDQLFNLKAGRIIQKQYGQKEQQIMTMQMLEGTDGRKMSTSWNNVILITDTPSDMYAKVMRIKDELIIQYFTLCTDVPLSIIGEYEDKLKKGEHPLSIKQTLARSIVSRYYGEEKAVEAEHLFTSIFKEGGVPEVTLVYTSDNLIEKLINDSIITSKSDLRRLIDGGAVTHVESKEKITSFESLEKTKGVVRIGAHRFITIQ